MPLAVGPQPLKPEGAAEAWASSDDSYDSEEERFRVRQVAAGRGAALRAEQAAQAELLRGYRARQQLRQQLEEEALRAKLQQQWRSGGEVTEEEERWHSSDAVGSRRGGRAGACPPAWLRLLQQHESSWAVLEAGKGAAAGEGTDSSSSSSRSSSCSSLLAYDDVPWPPLDCGDYLHGLAAWDQQQRQQQQLRQTQDQQELQKEPQQQQRAQRRAYARACLRWHPDKFEGRWGRRLAAADRPRILRRVQELSQGLNQAWEALQQVQQAQQQ